jgi:hypothetical protein
MGSLLRSRFRIASTARSCTAASPASHWLAAGSFVPPWPRDEGLTQACLVLRAEFDRSFVAELETGLGSRPRPHLRPRACTWGWLIAVLHLGHRPHRSRTWWAVRTLPDSPIGLHLRCAPQPATPLTLRLTTTVSQCPICSAGRGRPGWNNVGAARRGLYGAGGPVSHPVQNGAKGACGEPDSGATRSASCHPRAISGPLSGHKRGKTDTLRDRSIELRKRENPLVPGGFRWSG